MDGNFTVFAAAAFIILGILVGFGQAIIFIVLGGVFVIGGVFFSLWVNEQEAIRQKEARLVELQTNREEQRKKEEERKREKQKWIEKFENNLKKTEWYHQENDETDWSVNHEKLLNEVYEEHLPALRTDHRSIMRPDKYGRTTAGQELKWQKHLLEVIFTAKLDHEKDRERNLWATSAMYFYRSLPQDNYKQQFENFETTANKKLHERCTRSESYELLSDLDYVFSKIHNNFGKTNKSKSQIGVEYENKCANILEDSDWRVELTSGSGDQGADIIAFKGRLNIVIQCKWKSNGRVGNKAVQEALAAKNLHDADYGIVVSNVKFTQSATSLSDATNITLLHHHDLKELEQFLKF